MQRILTVGALVALGIGVLMIFAGTASAEPPVQGYPSTGSFAVNFDICYDQAGAGVGPTPAGATIVCGAGTSSTHLPLSATAVKEWHIVQIDAGNRFDIDFMSCIRGCNTATLPVTFTPNAPGLWGVDPTKAVCGTPVPGSCGAGSSTTGDVSGRWDLFCDGAPYDVLATSKLAGPVGWPDDPGDGSGWNPFLLVRTADALVTGPPGGTNSYANQMHPFPASFPFQSLDTTSVNKTFLGGGGGGLGVGPIPLQLYTVASSYMLSLSLTVPLLGNPRVPPTNDYLCEDTPQDTIFFVPYTTPPLASGLYPRWTTFQSAPDILNGDLTRILDVQCVGAGTVTSGIGTTDIGATDADDDCLEPPLDTDDVNPDQDGDGLPDGVEAAGGTEINGADFDLDGVSDFVEMFQYTDTRNPDTDSDGSLDRQDDGADEDGVSPGFIKDTTIDDNCPSVTNADQLNTDSQQNYHGGVTALNKAIVSISFVGTTATVLTATPHGLLPLAGVQNQVEISGLSGVSGGTASANQDARNLYNGSVKVINATIMTSSFQYIMPAVPPAGAALGAMFWKPSTGDATNPDQDTMGDACDPDDDNDGATDLSEASMTIIPWAGTGTTVCRGTGVGAPAAMLTLNGDTDGDMVLDGIECQQGSRPDVASLAVSPCAGPSGCAQPKAAVAGEDMDADLLFGSGLIGGNVLVENFYRTQQINQYAPAGQQNDIDGDGSIGSLDKDSDADWSKIRPAANAVVGLRDGLEVRYYGTEPANPDTDGDGCDDLREVVDIDGNHVVNTTDAALEAAKWSPVSPLYVPLLDDGLHGDPIAGDGVVNPLGVNFDLTKDKAINATDSSFLAFGMSVGAGLGNCTTMFQVGKVIAWSTRLPF